MASVFFGLKRRASVLNACACVVCAEAQVLVFDTTTGAATLQTRLTGLAAALGAAEGLFDVWSVDFA